jgi:hypothetical protein
LDCWIFAASRPVAVHAFLDEAQIAVGTDFDEEIRNAT